VVSLGSEARLVSVELMDCLLQVPYSKLSGSSCMCWAIFVCFVVLGRIVDLALAGSVA
jgi:hypothetical protein